MRNARDEMKQEIKELVKNGYIRRDQADLLSMWQESALTHPDIRKFFDQPPRRIQDILDLSDEAYFALKEPEIRSLIEREIAAGRCDMDVVNTITMSDITKLGDPEVREQILRGETTIPLMRLQDKTFQKYPQYPLPYGHPLRHIYGYYLKPCEKYYPASPAPPSAPSPESDDKEGMKSEVSRKVKLPKMDIGEAIENMQYKNVLSLLLAGSALPKLASSDLKTLKVGLAGVILKIVKKDRAEGMRLLELALDKKSILGKVFYAKRGMLEPSVKNKDSVVFMLNAALIKLKKSQVSAGGMFSESEAPASPAPPAPSAEQEKKGKGSPAPRRKKDS